MDRKRVKEVLREEKYRRKPRRKNRFLQLLGMMACLVILVAAMYGGLSLYTQLSGQFRETMENNVSGITLDEDGNVVAADGSAVSAASGSVLYTQEELDERIAAALLEAQLDSSPEILDIIRERLSEGEAVLDTLRSLYPEYIVQPSDGVYYFVPIDHSLAMNHFLNENLNILESGEIQYMENGQVISHKGIDVSKHQGAIDWNLVAQDGVEFAFIRVANRGYGSNGTLVEDERFDANIQGAQAAGIKVGVYIYSQAVNEAEVLEEANLVLQKIAPYTLDCPVVFDVEKVDDPSGRMNQISVEERTNLTLLFCQTIENAGYRPMIYHNLGWGVLALDLAALEGYDKWFASYSETLYYPYEYKVWQYSQTGTVQGVNTKVDLNICFEPLW